MLLVTGRYDDKLLVVSPHLPKVVRGCAGMNAGTVLFAEGGSSLCPGDEIYVTMITKSPSSTIASTCNHNHLLSMLDL